MFLIYVVVIPRADTWWNWLWVPRKCERASLYSAHQCVCKR